MKSSRLLAGPALIVVLLLSATLLARLPAVTAANYSGVKNLVELNDFKTSSTNTACNTTYHVRLIPAPPTG